MRKRFSGAAVIVMAAGSRVLFAAPPAPQMNLTSQTAVVGKPFVLKAADDSVIAPDSNVRVIVRFQGNQEMVEPQVDPGSKTKSWRFTPRNAGAYVIATSIEPDSTAGTERLFQYEKLFIRAAPDGPVADTTTRPSASAIARFGHRLEIDSIVDPSCLMVGGVMPIRVKFDGQTMKNMEVVATRRPDEPGATTDTPSTSKFNTGDNDFARIPISGTGRWTVVAEYRPDADGVRIRPGDRFVATMEFQVNRAKSDEGGKEKRSPGPRGE